MPNNMDIISFAPNRMLKSQSVYLQTILIVISARTYMAIAFIPIILKGKNGFWYGKVGPTKGRKASPDELKRRSESQKGKTLSEETKMKISEALKGDKSVWYGKKHTDESIAKMKENAANKRKIRCIETETIYDSIHDAGDKNNINYRNIHSVCAGKRKTAGGFHWEFVR